MVAIIKLSREYLIHVIKSNDEVIGRMDSKLSNLLIVNTLIFSMSFSLFLSNPKSKTISAIMLIITAVIIIINLVTLKSKFSNKDDLYKGTLIKDTIFYKDWSNMNCNELVSKNPELLHYIESAIGTAQCANSRTNLFTLTFWITLISIIVNVTLFFVGGVYN